MSEWHQLFLEASTENSEDYRMAPLNFYINLRFVLRCVVPSYKTVNDIIVITTQTFVPNGYHCKSLPYPFSEFALQNHRIVRENS